MSIPTDYISNLVNELSQGRLENLIKQADARRILQEVKEIPENYPDFAPLLTEKATHIAYALLSCGCSLMEKSNSNFTAIEILSILEKAGKLLSDIYKYNDDEFDWKDYNLLISGMALYAAKQYSRAFIVLNNVNLDFVVGQIVIQFINKDFNSLLQNVNQVFFEPPNELSDIQSLDEWVISHEIARIFLMVVDFVQTGNKSNFVSIDNIFDKLLSIATESNLISYWLIVRLLKIILSTFREASLWTILPPLLPVQHRTENYIRLLSGFKPAITELWPSQTMAIPLAVGENSGGVINLRTSGGKTRVAEIAILNTLSKHIMSKTLYLAPFRSLAFEVEQSLSKTFSPLGITVSQLYGGSTANVTDFELIKQSQVIVATPEKAKALIRCGSGLETELKLIVIDEGHLLGAEERYIKNEIFLTHVNEFASRNQIKMLLLSAVLPNANELADWVAADTSLVAKSEWKPALERLGLLLWDGERVRLEWGREWKTFNPNFVQKAPLGFGRRRKMFPNNKKEAIAATAVRLAKTGTVMIYSARANSIEGLAESVLSALGEHQENFLWDCSLWNVFESVCKEELSENDIILIAARKGVICHNNRLPTLVRIAMERLMRSKPPLIIIASSTLGQGVNVGISSIIVSTPYYDQNCISNRDFWNICGRAGRAFSDVEGKILYAIDTTEEAWKVSKNHKLARNYFDNRQMERVQSGLLIALKAIYENAMKTNTDFNLLVEAIANDFIYSDINEKFVEWINRLFDYLDDELLAMHENFCLDENDVTWVDGVFRKSLAIIQADSSRENEYIRLLRARTKALLKKVPDKRSRQKIIASGIPLSVSQRMLDSVEDFRALALLFASQSTSDEYIAQIDRIVREIEIWSNLNAKYLVGDIPEQDCLERIRHDWISGMPLSEIIKNEPTAEKITKDYYGFTLPWIIHGISQLFDPVLEETIVQTYSSIAMFIELGLPNITSSNIYMAGVRSRSAALELASIDIFNGKSVPEIKRILTSVEVSKENISNIAQVWIDLFSNTAKSQSPKRVSFPSFTWNRDDLPDRLYLREQKNQYYLLSSDGYFCEKVESTKDLPFSKIANIVGLYFECREGTWYLQSYNPRIIIG
jgi:DEAD/DEAH box helicase domain-containing protein